ncbi:MAG TPA: bifunctional histidinol-phosphatase/imidazoleglycerol-phosphate dehydratase HisB [Chitinophagales bacterium]|nr:bifunctional histidinol-phosphatase/imidazoleglycerol-phosphate dehydratase HisB [Chitinophagales bacterium]
MKKVLFIDRDGTLILETDDYQIEKFEKLTFYPQVFYWLGKIARELDYELVMVTNQDGLGTVGFPEKDFWEVQNFIVKTFENEGIKFEEVFIDKSYPHDNLPTRKPGTGMLTQYFSAHYNLADSFVIGDRITDVQLAKNLGCKCFYLNDGRGLGSAEISNSQQELKPYMATESRQWEDIYNYLKGGPRKASHSRNTKETQISIELNLDGTGKANISTGLNFLNHMLEQIARHGNVDLAVNAKGDLHIDEHHTTEDTAIALGEAFALALGDKMGIERYGYCLPMDDALAQVAIDFGGRNWIEWQAEFKREKVGDVPTEMFFHFFKSFSDAAKCNLNIKAEGDNEHHKIEAIFKAFAKAIKMAVKRDLTNMQLPSTKGVL